MSTEKNNKMRRFINWKRKTGKLFRKDDDGGRPLPDSVKEYGHYKPYGGTYKSQTPADKGDTADEQATET